MTTRPPTTALSRIGQIALTVSDLDRSVAFYRDVLGLTLLFSVPRLAFFDCAGVRLMLSLPEGAGGGPRGDAVVLYFAVADIDGAVAALRERGVRFDEAPHLVARMPDHELWMVAFRDPDGQPLELMCERR